MTICLDIETVADIPEAHASAVARMAEKREQAPETFAALSPMLSRVVCVGMLNLDTGGARCPVNLTDEAALLAEVNSVLAKTTRLVTFNGRGFDVPVLIHRSVINGVPVAPVLWAAANQKPWEDRPHVDAMNVLSFGGTVRRYSLEAWAIGYGLANPKSGGDGSCVAEMVAAGDTESLTRYCMGDVETTAALYRRFKGGV